MLSNPCALDYLAAVMEEKANDPVAGNRDRFEEAGEEYRDVKIPSLPFFLHVNLSWERNGPVPGLTPKFWTHIPDKQTVKG